MVQITGFDVKHNHNVSKAVYENYVSNRRVEDPSILAFADELRAAGSKPKLVMQYLRKKTGGFGWIMGDDDDSNNNALLFDFYANPSYSCTNKH
ncbi:hypothetical protein PInf_000675 [Phytophthora infestans]|nr:hypothetical protein PInf_000675 [Phytophthora infestans]